MACEMTIAGNSLQSASEDVASGPATEQKVRVDGVSKAFLRNGSPLWVLDDVDLHASEGEFVSIIGPSGCGKSTLFNIIAGLDEPSTGTIYVDGIRADNRLGSVGYMQQKDLLLPWKNVVDNAILGMELRGVSRSEARARAMEFMGPFGLEGFEKEYPFALSGGMRQRASFLRTVLADSEVFLLDEPFGALDALNRAQIHAWLLGLWENLRKTILLVTHDVDEAIFLADRVYVMSERPGRMKLVQQVDLPRPRTLEMLTQPAFVSLKATLLRSIREED